MNKKSIFKQVGLTVISLGLLISFAMVVDAIRDGTIGYLLQAYIKVFLQALVGVLAFYGVVGVYRWLKKAIKKRKK